MLEPVFNEAADEVKKIFTEPGRIIFAKVDCDKESKFHRRPIAKLIILLYKIEIFCR